MFISGQEEILFPIDKNTSLRFENNKIKSRSSLDSITRLSLPLQDDFSYYSTVPSKNLYNNTVIDTFFTTTYYLDTANLLDTNRLLKYTYRYFTKENVGYDSNGTYFCIDKKLGLIEIVGDSSDLDTIDHSTVVFRGFEIDRITVDSIQMQNLKWTDSISPNQSYYDSVVRYTTNAINEIRSDEVFDLIFNEYEYKFTLSDTNFFQGTAFVDSVLDDTSRLNALAITVRVLLTKDTLDIEHLIVDTGYLNLSEYNLWLDQDVYINRSFGLYPPSIGVATFDGMDENGVPYSDDLDAYGGADSLTSAYINLSNHEPSDSVLLSFFYQMEGRGDLPNTDDSLVLEFKDLRGEWIKVWPSKIFVPQSQFEQVFIMIEDEEYFHNNFQFRFRNKATITGILDHWNLDYVRLRDDASVKDSTFGDISIAYVPKSFVKDYTAMPWSHYDSILDVPDGLMDVAFYSNMKDENIYELNRVIINPQQDSFTLAKSATVPNDLYDLYADPISGYLTANTLNDTLFYYTGLLASKSLDDVEFEIQYIFMPQVGDGGVVVYDENRNNDTIIAYQTFADYYAYDDGSAEFAYGVSSPVEGAKLALNYNFKQVDTLRGFYVHWARKNANLSNESFKFTVWTQLGDNDELEEEVLYSNSIDYLSYTDSINAWMYYELDSMLVLDTGSYFVGWEQISLEKLNIGFDINTNARGNLFFNTNGTWQSSKLEGSIMLRPSFGSATINNIVDIESIDASVYPNPFEDVLNLELNQNATYRIYDIGGRLQLSGDLFSGNTKLDMSNLERGIYFIQFNQEGKQQIVKLIKP